MEAFLYLRIKPGFVGDVATQLPTRGVRRAVIVVGEWDILALTDGPDMATIASTVLESLHQIEGVERTLTVPIVPNDRLGDLGGGFGMMRPPMLTPGDACYVHIKAAPGAVPGIVERLSEMEDVSGVAATAGEFDVLAEIQHPWEVASGMILEQIHPLPGVMSTRTMVAFPYEEREEDRDQFSAWS